MKIATIYNDEERLNIEVHWDSETGKITYHIEDGRVEDAGETADTLQEAVDDTYDRYRYGWYLEFEELVIRSLFYG